MVKRQKSTNETGLIGGWMLLCSALQLWVLFILAFDSSFPSFFTKFFLSIVLWLRGASDRDCLLSCAYIAFSKYFWRFDVFHFPRHAIVIISSCIESETASFEDNTNRFVLGGPTAAAGRADPELIGRPSAAQPLVIR